MEQERLTPVQVARAAATVRTIPDHGTRARYVHRTLKCRCPDCTAQNTRYQQGYRARIARAAPWAPRTWEQLTLPGTVRR